VTDDILYSHLGLIRYLTRLRAKELWARLAGLRPHWRPAAARGLAALSP
jgi:hypothetical protein